MKSNLHYGQIEDVYISVTQPVPENIMTQIKSFIDKYCTTSEWEYCIEYDTDGTIAINGEEGYEAEWFVLNPKCTGTIATKTEGRQVGGLILALCEYISKEYPDYFTDLMIDIQ